MTQNPSSSAAEILNVDTTPEGPLKKAARRIRKKPSLALVGDPREALRQLVGRHMALNKISVATGNAVCDRKLKNGETSKCRLADVEKEEGKAFAKVMSKHASALETEMLRQLRHVPIYTTLLKHVFGLGPVACAYLVAYVDIRKCEKPDQLIRYCGNACGRDGKRESLASEESKDGSHFNAALKSIIWQAMKAMFKNCYGARVNEDEPNQTKTTKYVMIWQDYKHRAEHNGELTSRGAGFVDNKGRRKATDVLLEDVYTVWRALEGLPVWPDWYAAARGYKHGGEKINVDRDGPQTLTVEEALALVGDVGAQPIGAAPIEGDRKPEEKGGTL